MWGNRLASVWNRALGRRLVGRDAFGNDFYLQASEAGQPDRRIVENKKSGTPDSAAMDTLWWAWLHSRRESPPLPEEIARAAQAREILAEKVAVLEAEDEKNRLRGLVGGGGGPTRGSTPAERKRDALRQLASTGVDPGLSDRPQPSDKRGGRPKDPEVHTGAEPTGSGDTFKPGSWTPN